MEDDVVEDIDPTWWQIDVYKVSEFPTLENYGCQRRAEISSSLVLLSIAVMVDASGLL